MAVRHIRHDDEPSSASRVTPPTKPSSSPTTVKMKSVCCSGTYEPVRLRALELALAGDAPRTDGDLRLVWLYARAGLFDERGQPVALVLLQHAGLQDAATPNSPSSVSTMM